MRRTAHWAAQATKGQLHGDGDTPFTRVVTNSRDVIAGAAYVARVGENSDGHDYIPAAIERGATVIIGQRVNPDCPVAQVIVEDSTIALGAIAHEHVAEHRAKGELTVLAVTGSAGKTTTKDLMAQILGAVAPTVAPKFSFNNEVGLPLTALQTDDDTRYLVLEMGASGPGHLRYLTDIVSPDIAIELMVGHAHLGGFGSVQGIADAKKELIEGMRHDGVAILNADDDNVRAMAKDAPGDIRFFTAKGAADASYSAENIVCDEAERASFTLTRCLGESVQRAEVTLNVVGAHHVHNAVAAAAACCEAGLAFEDVAAALSQATVQSPHRMAVSEIKINGHRVTLIDDAYNANSDSMRAALRTACAIARQDQLIAVFGEMLELGEASEATHQEVGQWAREYGVQNLVALGAEAVHYCQGLGLDAQSLPVMSVDEAVEATLNLIQQPSVVLVKGSNGSGAWRVADAMVERGQMP